MYHKIMKERFSIRVLDVVNLAVMYKNEMEGISILSHNYLLNRERSNSSTSCKKSLGQNLIDRVERSNLAVISVVASEVSDKIHSK